MAYIDVIETTSSSITVQVNGLQTGYIYDDRTCYWYLAGYYYGSSKLMAYASSGGAYTFNGLDPNTSYNIYCNISAPAWTNDVELWGTASTNGSSGSGSETYIQPWDWHNSNGNASAGATVRALAAVQNNGTLTDFSYLVWNDMVDKVQEILYAKGEWWNNYFLSYDQTLMNSWDKELTADRFNSLRYNIGTHYPTGINTVYQGDVVYGWYFITLTNCMNYWIEE